MNFPILTNDWTAFQELKFLEAMEIHGFGNWNEISSKMEDKSSAEVEEHFTNCYRPFLNDPYEDNFEETFDKRV